MLRNLGLIAAALACTGCATVVNGSRQTVGINSTPTGAIVKIDGGIVGKTPWTGKIERKESTVIALEKEGYDGQVLQLQGESSGWVWGNIFTCGFFGTTTDFSSGGAYQYEPGTWHVVLEQPGVVSPASKRDASIKRYILASYAQLTRQIVSSDARSTRGSRSPNTDAPEQLRTLRGLMGMDDRSDGQMRELLRPAATIQTNPDAFAEAVILMLPPEAKLDPPK